MINKVFRYNPDRFLIVVLPDENTAATLTNISLLLSLKSN